MFFDIMSDEQTRATHVKNINEAKNPTILLIRFLLFSSSGVSKAYTCHAYFHTWYIDSIRQLAKTYISFPAFKNYRSDSINIYFV